ncbi:hypothetical protein ACFX13_016006 [Malus domestica]
MGFQHIAPLFEPLESSLLDLVSEGLLSQEKFDSSNLPIYCPYADELEKLVQENGCFDVLVLETQPQMPSVLRTAQECRACFDTHTVFPLQVQKYFQDMTCYDCECRPDTKNTLLLPACSSAANSLQWRHPQPRLLLTQGVKNPPREEAALFMGINKL